MTLGEVDHLDGLTLDLDYVEIQYSNIKILALSTRKPSSTYELISSSCLKPLCSTCHRNEQAGIMVDRTGRVR